MKRTHKTSVHGTHYVLHLSSRFRPELRFRLASSDDKTLCGRNVSDVNCAAGPEPEDAICRSCAKVAAKAGAQC